ncbi:MAG: [FeFe] hydrogenase H-cluster maturation GTPase HydF [Mediterranea sp.]|jgi:[FeFe] hydrogenase H-cluster maturation GTPase HydF|nr:[FeFe] hydrogenase H-cluster maturation GTPase HydF [Mediterranea sp.]
MTETPNANRLHIALFGKRNSGKSSLVNALTGQEAAVVSDTPGTTTDPVTKAMEIRGIGPCLFIDTPGFDDEGTLGERRVERALRTMERADIALLLCGGDGSAPQPDLADELDWYRQLRSRHIPTILVLNKSDARQDPSTLATRIAETFGTAPLSVSAKQGIGMEQIRQAILERLPEEFGRQSITGALATEGDLVLLVMPQDIQAPKGRLILPQAQTIRELLDKKCLVMSCTTDKLADSLRALARPPRLIITDSQVFATVYGLKPPESLLTSFSILFAAHKGDIGYYAESAAAIDRLTENSRVLIAEACTHAPLAEDIGRVKLPRLLRQRVGQGLAIDIVSGTDFPADLSPYQLVVHCGACMFNRRYALARIGRAKEQGVPMTNYGVAIAYLNGILDKVALPRPLCGEPGPHRQGYTA